ncbi:hypothetical protein HNR73_002789 [Phytomonospora endophytica]|uniref:Uncharacterized protein n=1 Tax=Phytomonospora endophytica TaxID=714109 RepID=A0A841FGW9_9ACTN|nr:hypothetical protein [Phytomonospora endophytica]
MAVAGRASRSRRAPGALPGGRRRVRLPRAERGEHREHRRRQPPAPRGSRTSPARIAASTGSTVAGSRLPRADRGRAPRGSRRAPGAPSPMQPPAPRGSHERGTRRAPGAPSPAAACPARIPRAPEAPPGVRLPRADRGRSSSASGSVRLLARGSRCRRRSCGSRPHGPPAPRGSRTSPARPSPPVRGLPPPAPLTFASNHLHSLPYFHFFRLMRIFRRFSSLSLVSNRDTTQVGET